MRMQEQHALTLPAAQGPEFPQWGRQGYSPTPLLRWVKARSGATHMEQWWTFDQDQTQGCWAWVPVQEDG